MCVWNNVEYGGVPWRRGESMEKCSQCISWETESHLAWPVCGLCLSQRPLIDVRMWRAEMWERAHWLFFTTSLEGICYLFRKGKQIKIHVETFLRRKNVIYRRNRNASVVTIAN